MSAAPWWFTALMMAEMAFVACFFTVELLRFALRSYVVDMERKIHALSAEKYVTGFGLPVIAMATGAGMVVGAAFYTDGQAGGAVNYAGLLLILAMVFAFGYYRFRFATDTWPRPVSRAQIRRRLAETREQLATSRLSVADLAVLEKRLKRTVALADRLAARANSASRWTAIRRERWWLVAAAALATLVPLPFAAIIGWRLIFDDANPQRWAVLGFMLLLSCTTLAAAEIRRVRHRMDARDLATELRGESMALLARLESTPADSDVLTREGFAIDIVGYSKRLEPAQRELQKRMVGCVERIVDGVGIPWNKTDRQPNGDGMIVFLPVGTRIPTLLRLIEAAIAELAQDNGAHGDRMRWRMAMDVGVVVLAPAGFSGDAVIALSRMIDSAPIKAAATANQSADLVLVVSDLFFDNAVRNAYSTTITPDEFRPEQVEIKEYNKRVWIWEPNDTLATK